MLVDSVRIQTNDSRAAGGDAAFAPDNADGLDLDSCRDVVVRDLPWNIRREGGQSLVIGGSSLVILEGKARNPL